MVSVIGIKKCPKCGHKETYGCHNYYTIGAPFFCSICKSVMNYAPYKFSMGYVSDKQYNKDLKYFTDHLETIDYEIKEKGNSRINILWKGV